MNYRKLWEQHYGPIPKDSDGRTYEIHHIDGNRSNNDITNLQCVSLQEHYDIHYLQGEYGACLRIAIKLGKSKEEISETATKNNLKRVKEGTNPFCDSEFNRKKALKMVAENRHPWQGPDYNIKLQNKRVAEGSHHFLGGKHHKERVLNGTHHLLGGFHQNNQLKAGKHPSQIKFVCPNCNKEGFGKAMMYKWHFDNCKEKQNV